MKILFSAFFIFFVTYTECQTGEYFSSEQKIVLANFVTTNLKETKPTYFAFQITKTLQYSYFYMRDAPRAYPQNKKKTWSKGYTIIQSGNNVISCKDLNGNFVDFVFDEFSAQPSITMKIYKGNKLAKEIIYFIN